MTQTIAIIDYGMGNLRSVQQALLHVTPRDNVLITANPAEIAQADRVVFPGQGAARDCMAAIQRQQLQGVIQQAAQNKPFLGICMGLQVLMTHSAENQGTPLLNLYPGKVQRFSHTPPDAASLKIPHMGWNQVKLCQPHPLWHNIPSDSYFYFVHSYHVVPDQSDIIHATANYGTHFVAAIAHHSLFACQFHPEKSADVGLQLLSNFVRWQPVQNHTHAAYPCH